LDSPYTIPVRVHADFAKIVERAERKEEAGEEAGEVAEVTDRDAFDDEDSFWAHEPEENE
jgi:hypothetical protein